MLTSPKPIPRPKPYPNTGRLRAVKKMTIAIGIIASDGIVIAADREEGDGYLKNDRGKIYNVFRGRQPIGSLAVAGAGDGSAIDEVSKLLGDTFCDDSEQRNSGAVKSAIEEAHRSYYEKIILPFALQPAGERPDYALLIGCLGGGTGKSLFVTSRLAVNPVDDYEAVGVGATVANSWLGRLYDNLPIQYAVKLAAYVIFQVKNVVGGCGLGTDIVALRPNSILESVPPFVSRQWEDAFRFFPTIERQVFNYCMGLDTAERLLYRSKLGKDSIESDIEILRKKMSELDWVHIKKQAATDT